MDANILQLLVIFLALFPVLRRHLRLRPLALAAASAGVELAKEEEEEWKAQAVPPILFRRL